ncbi:enkurin [Oreochromis aureus]|uniref:Enkurin domain-containing protein n=1 Tax=Oreochromis aureus TaxID=47969 RepID=A0AAZ1XXB4_OREAU|nr:enkurin [Oreochromis aureus]
MMSEDVHPPENAFNLLPVEDKKKEKAPRYVSKFRPAAMLERKLVKEPIRTMGPARVELPSPENFLKKHSKEPKLPEQMQSSKDVHKTCSFTERKPPVPRRNDKPLMGIHTKRDFLKETPVLVPMKPQPACVDTSKGHKQVLENSGLVPKFITRKDFGRVPAYLQQRSEAERRAREEYENFVKAEREQRAMKHMTQEERQAILKHLKETWDKLHHEYQALPLIIDTVSQRATKDCLERQMKQLEDDINLFERFKIIYIPKDD